MRPAWWPSFHVPPQGKLESGAGSAYGPSIIQEPEQDKAEVKQGPTQQGEHRGSGHHDADLGICFHMTSDSFDSRPTGKSEYLHPEPWQGPQRPVVSQPHCIPPLEDTEKDFFLASNLQERLGLGDRAETPPAWE